LESIYAVLEMKGAMFQDPSIHIFSYNVVRLTTFYERLGLRKTYRTPKDGTPVHVEVTLERFSIGISSVEVAIRDDHHPRTLLMAAKASSGVSSTTNEVV